MLIRCTYCNTEFHRSPSQVKASKRHYCSRECHNEWRRKKGRTDVICDHCSKKFSLINSKLDTTRFCSRSCRLKGLKAEYVDLVCKYCENQFTRKRAQVFATTFCDRECSARWNSEYNNRQATIECLICSKKFNVQRSRANTAKTCSRKCHGVWLSEYYAKTKEGKEHYRNNGIKTTMNQNYSQTKPERIMSEFLIHNNIEFIPQHLMYDKFIVDFYLPNNNIVIEVFGDYWHGNPKFYGETGALKPLTKKQNKQKSKDRSREAYLKKCGHEFHILWEDDIYNKLSEITEFLIE